MQLTIGGSAWIARKVESRKQMHGFLVGLLVAIVVLTLGGRPFDLARLSEAVLTLAAGGLGGRLGSRS